MKVNVDFAVYVDVIEFEPFMGEDTQIYQDAFNDYFCENWNDDMYMESETIVKWMNEIAPSCNARIIERNIYPGKEDTSLPYICF